MQQHLFKLSREVTVVHLSHSIAAFKLPIVFDSLLFRLLTSPKKIIMGIYFDTWAMTHYLDLPKTLVKMTPWNYGMTPKRKAKYQHIP